MLLLLAALAAAQPAPIEMETEPTETRCDYLTGGRAVSAPDLHVLEQTRGAGGFTTTVPAGAAIRCGRSVMVPSENDWKVLAAGHVLVIVEVSDAPEQRTAVLEIDEGRVRFRFLRGRMTEHEAARINARMNAFQPHFER